MLESNLTHSLKSTNYDKINNWIFILKEADVEEQSTNRQQVCPPGGEQSSEFASGGSLVEGKAGREENVRKVVETTSNRTEETSVEHGPVRV